MMKLTPILRPLLRLSAALIFIGLGGAVFANADSLPGKGVTARPVYDGESNDIFQALIVMEGLKRLGYSVPPLAQTTVPLEVMAVGQGDVEFEAEFNDPLHNSYYEKA